MMRHPHATTPRRRTAIRGFATLATLALVLVACGGDDSVSGGFETTEGAPEAPAFDGAVEDMADAEMAESDTADRDVQVTDEGGRSDATNGNGATAAANAGRRVIRTATLELEVEDTAAAAERIVAIATDAGGFVAETDLQRDREGVVRGSITLRVPSAELFDTVDALDELAVAVPIRRIDERDVTALTTDLRAQRDNLIAYETELNALLGDIRESAERADELLVVFERIREVRGEIDRIDAQLASLGDQVALATISVSLQPAASALPVTDPTWSANETIRDALSTTSRALTSIADGAIVLLLTVLPIAVLLIAPVLVPIVWIWRRQRRREPGDQSGTAPSDGAPSAGAPSDGATTDGAPSAGAPSDGAPSADPTGDRSPTTSTPSGDERPRS